MSTVGGQDLMRARERKRSWRVHVKKPLARRERKMAEKSKQGCIELHMPSPVSLGRV